jgi:hypothetical protein
VSNKIKQLKVIYWVYLTIVGGYIFYGYAAKTGLYALLIDQQLKMFGKADGQIALLIPFVVLLLPVAPVAQYVRKQKRLARSQGGGVHGGTNSLAANPEKPSQWIWLGAAALAPLLISVGAYIYLTASAANDQQRPIFHMDLARSADLPAGDVKFIEIAGIFQQDSEYTLTEDNSGTKSGHRYGPLTDASWNPAQPVKYLLYLGSQGVDQIAIGHYDKQTGRVDSMPPKGPYNSTFGGVLSKDGLPDYVKSGLERRGLKLTEPYYVLDWKGDLDLPGASRSGGQMYYLIPFLGAFFSLVVFAGGAIAFVNRKRQRARMAR